MRRSAVVVVGSALSVLVAACAGNMEATTTSPEDTTTSTSPAPTSTVPPVVECPGAGEFGEGGGIADVDGEGSDARRLSQISWDRSDRCESFTFVFETSEGAPATTVPDVAIDHLDSLQVIRVSMGVTGAVLTDQLVETGLVDRLYVVRSFDGGLFVDLHLTEPAAARARVQSSPAVLTLDLRPGLLDFTGSATIDDNTVVVAPTDGTEISPNTTFTGYSRAFEANVTVIVTQGDEVVTSTNTTAADYLQTWGEFSIDLELPEGEVSVFLGEASPVDGSLNGVTLDLTVG